MPKRSANTAKLVEEKVQEDVVQEEPAVDLESKVEMVLMALQNRDYKVDSRKVALLEKTASTALLTPFDERHESEDVVVEELQTLFAEIETPLRAKYTAAQGKVDGFEEERSAALKVVTDAEAALSTAETEKIQAQENQKTTEGMLTGVLTAKEEAVQGKEDLEKALEDAKLLATKIGDFHANFGDKASKEEGCGVEGMKEIKEILKEIPNLEDSLRNAASEALRKPFAERGPFDSLALTSAETALGNAKVSAEERIQSTEALCAEQVEKIAAATKGFDEGIETMAAANEAVTEKTDAVKAAKVAVKEANAAVDDLEPKRAKIQEELDAAALEMESFYHHLSAFKFLQTRSACFTPVDDWTPWRPAKCAKVADASDDPKQQLVFQEEPAQVEEPAQQVEEPTTTTEAVVEEPAQPMAVDLKEVAMPKSPKQLTMEDMFPLHVASPQSPGRSKNIVF